MTDPEGTEHPTAGFRSSRPLWAVLRLAAAALILTAIAAQLSLTLEIARAANRDVPTTLVNFFSFFTILSNLLAAIVLALAALRDFAKRGAADALPPRLATALACATTYMLITGIVYNTLLRGIPLPQGATLPWSNEVLHVIGPAFMLLDLLVAARSRLRWSALTAIAIVPIAWVVYTLIRGPLTMNPATGARGWYPYPFLDPRNPELTPAGYAGVAVYVVGIAAAVIGVAALVVLWNRKRSFRSR